MSLKLRCAERSDIVTCIASTTEAGEIVTSTIVIARDFGLLRDFIARPKFDKTTWELTLSRVIITCTPKTVLTQFVSEHRVFTTHHPELVSTAAHTAT